MYFYLKKKRENIKWEVSHPIRIEQKVQKIDMIIILKMEMEQKMDIIIIWKIQLEQKMDVGFFIINWSRILRSLTRPTRILRVNSWLSKVSWSNFNLIYTLLGFVLSEIFVEYLRWKKRITDIRCQTWWSWLQIMCYVCIKLK